MVTFLSKEFFLQIVYIWKLHFNSSSIFCPNWEGLSNFHYYYWHGQCSGYLLLSNKSLQRFVVPSNYYSVLIVLWTRAPKGKLTVALLPSTLPRASGGWLWVWRCKLGGSLLRDFFTFLTDAVEGRLTWTTDWSTVCFSSISNHCVGNSPTVLHAVWASVHCKGKCPEILCS